MTERKVFDWPYPSPFMGFALESIVFIVGGYFVSYVLSWLGALLILVGFGVIVLGCIAETRYTIVCTMDGFTVDRKRRLGKTRHTTYAWHEVCETGYREVMRDIYFAAYTDRGRAFEVRRIRTRSRFVRGRFEAFV